MAPLSPSSYQSADPPGTPTVLLIDEDSDFREALAENLREDGYLVHAYDRAANVPPVERLPHLDLIVTDASGFSRGGMAFVEGWHRMHPDLPVLVLTSDAASAWDSWADRIGGVEVRRKPIDYERVRSAVRALSARLG